MKNPGWQTHSDVLSLCLKLFENGGHGAVSFTKQGIPSSQIVHCGPSELPVSSEVIPNTAHEKITMAANDFPLIVFKL
jgi:hypothetical protein